MVNMQLLEFNSTDKTVVLRSGFNSGDKLVSFSDVPTVKIEGGYYEVMQKVDTGTIPVLRVPISNTNMLIKK
jgi:hypothetical protein